jgi:hypothetical protein
VEHFEYIMVLTSIIIGLGIAHILLGIGGIVDRLVDPHSRIRTSSAYAAWLANVFVWLVAWWWWEFRFSELVETWSVGLYFFLIAYAVLLFLMAAILVPRSWDGVDDLGAFFVERRVWFYAAYLLVICLDILDAYLKNGLDYIASLGAISVFFWPASVIVCVIGIRSTHLRFHTVAGLTLLTWNVLLSFVSLPVLGL